MKVAAVVVGLGGVFLLFSLSSCALKPQEITAKQGYLDLSAYSFEQPARLDGEWVAAWGQIVSPEAAFTGSPALLPASFQAQGHPAQSQVTYQLKLRVPPGNRLWTLRIPSILTAYRLWVDKQLVAQAGKLGQPIIPADTVQWATFSTPSGTEAPLTLTLQVENSEFYIGGVLYSLTLGPEPLMKALQGQQSGLDFFLVGALFLVLIWYIGMGLANSASRNILWLGLFGVVAILRIIATSAPVWSLFSGIPWEIQKKCEFLILNAGSIPLLIYIRKSFPQEFSAKLITILSLPLAILGLLFLLFPVSLTGPLLLPSEVISILSLVFVLVILIQATLRRRPGAWIFLISLVLVGIAAVNDTLHSFQLSPFPYLLREVFLAFLLVQGLVQAQAIRATFRLSEDRGRELERINANIARFFPNDFLRLLDKRRLQDVYLGEYHTKELCILFCDIRNFTALAETLPPEKTFRLLNAYFSQIGPVIRHHGGFIDKYIGDGIMALFPNGPQAGILAASAIQASVQVYNHHRANSGYSPLTVGCGLYSGTVTIGTIGEAQRLETTVISDVVNLASRLESLTKVFGQGTLTTLSVLDQVDISKLSWRYAGVVKVYGKKQPQEVVHIWNGLEERTSELFNITKSTFEQGLAAYRTGQLEQAQTAFKEVLAQHPEDAGARYYFQRIQTLLTFGLPENWDAVEEQLK